MNTYPELPYTYLIGWSKVNKYYYGVRFAKNCNPSDLWNTYFTSSKHVKEFRRKYGEPDIIQIRKTFNTITEARKWEARVLSKIDAMNDERYLNRTNVGSIRPDDALRGSRASKKGVNKGFVHSAETRAKMSRNKIEKNIQLREYYNSIFLLRAY